MSSTGRYKYSQEHLATYFDRIALPRGKRIFNVSNLSDNEQLEYLKTLIKHQLVRIPFENLVQHYSWHRVIDVSPLHVFRKVMNNPGRGGYCMEANSLLHTLLYSLGFNCYIAAGRVWIGPQQKWTGWTHLVNLVTIGGVKYLCDVGFGSNEPIVPVPLQVDEIVQQITPAESKLVHETIGQNISDTKLWMHMFRTDPDAEWTPTYCFTETEILPTDIPELNFSPWLSRTIHFTQKVVVVRHTTNKEGDKPGLASEQSIDDGEIDGTLIIDHDKFKWRRNGKTIFSTEFNSDEERVDALRKYWGIELDVEDREAIFGTVGMVATKE